MTLLAVVVNAFLKPLLIALWGWCQYCAMQSFSAGMRHGQLLGVIVLLPITVGLALLLPAPLITVEIPYLSLFKLDLFNDILGVLALYLMVASWGLCYVFLGVYTLFHQVHSCHLDSQDRLALQDITDQLLAELNLPRNVKLLLDADCPSPYSFAATVVLPLEAARWDTTKLRLILLHELGHIARHDWRNLLVSKVVCWLFWFIPLVWLVARHLDAMAERACDDWVLRCQGRPAQYAELLLELSQGVSDLPANHFLGCSHYERMYALLENYQDRAPSASPESITHLFPVFMLLLVMSQVGIHSSNSDSLFMARPLIIERSVEGLGPPVYESIDTQKRPTVVLKRPFKKMEQIFVVAELTPWDGELSDIDFEHDAQVRTVEISGYLPEQLVTPRYPRRALARNLEGRVRVQFGLDEFGRVVEPRVEYASPRGVFEKNVLEALQQSRFKPLLVNGEATPVTELTETFHFQLLDEHPPPLG